MRQRKLLAALGVVAGLVAACGGGGDGGGSSGGGSGGGSGGLSEPARITTLKVVGDSLNDAGTFGFKFTVQGDASSPTRIWVDQVASGLNVTAVCPRYTPSTPTRVVLNPAVALCTGYAVGGAAINPAGADADSTGYSITQQLRDLGASGSLGAGDLLLVGGGGNDAAALLGAYLGAGGDGAAAYLALLSEVLPASAVQAAASGGQAGLASAGAAYMQALAGKLAQAVRTEALDKGVQRALVINAPDITRTPRFTAVLAGVALAAGGGTTGQAAAAAVRTLAQTWVAAFNQQLASSLAGESRVALVDFFAELNKWVDRPGDFGLTNASTPACPATGIDTSGLLTYSINTCLATALPADRRFYVFSDNFHGTPRVNELFGQAALAAIAAKGWR